MSRKPSTSSEGAARSLPFREGDVGKLVIGGGRPSSGDPANGGVSDPCLTPFSRFAMMMIHTYW